MTHLPAIGGGAGGGGGGFTPLWQFDPDVALADQFVSAGAPDVALGGGTPGALSVVSVTDRGDVLRYTGGTGSNVFEVFLFAKDGTEVLTPTTNRMRNLRFVFENFAGVGFSSDIRGGLFFYGGRTVAEGAGPPTHGFAHMISDDSGVRFQDGVVSDTSTGGTQANRGGQLTVQGQKEVPGRPSCISTLWGQAFAGFEAANRRSGANIEATGALGDLNTPGATWDDTLCNRVGFVIQSRSAAGPPTSWDFPNLSLYAMVGP